MPRPVSLVGICYHSNNTTLAEVEKWVLIWNAIMIINSIELVHNLGPNTLGKIKSDRVCNNKMRVVNFIGNNDMI